MAQKLGQNITICGLQEKYKPPKIVANQTRYKKKEKKNVFFFFLLEKKIKVMSSLNMTLREHQYAFFSHRHAKRKSVVCYSLFLRLFNEDAT